MLNLRTAVQIIKLFNATFLGIRSDLLYEARCTQNFEFYILVCNVEATLRYCKKNTSKCAISVIAIAMLN